MCSPTKNVLILVSINDSWWIHFPKYHVPPPVLLCEICHTWKDWFSHFSSLKWRLLKSQRNPLIHMSKFCKVTNHSFDSLLFLQPLNINLRFITASTTRGSSPLSLLHYYLLPKLNLRFVLGLNLSVSPSLWRNSVSSLQPHHNTERHLPLVFLNPSSIPVVFCTLAPNRNLTPSTTFRCINVSLDTVTKSFNRCVT